MTIIDNFKSMFDNSSNLDTLKVMNNLKVLDTIGNIDTHISTTNDGYNYNPLEMILNGGSATIGREQYGKIYKENSFVYAPINLISNTIVKLDYGVYKNGKIKEDKNLDLITNHLMKSIVSTFVAYGDVFIYQYKIGNTIKELEVLNSADIKFSTESGSTNKNKDFFEYKKDNKRYKLETKNLISIVGYDPTNNKRGVGFIEAGIRNIQVIQEIDKWNKYLLSNSGNVGGKYKVPKKLNKDEREAIKRGFDQKQSGANNAGKNMVLGEGEEYEIFTQSLKDMDFTELKKWNIEELLSCAGVNKGVLGKEDSLNYATLEAYRDIFSENTIIPLTIQVQDGFNDAGIFDGEFKFINVKNEASENIFAMYNNGISSLNEARSMLGLIPIQDGDVIYKNGLEISVTSKELKDEYKKKEEKKVSELQTIFSDFKDSFMIEVEKDEKANTFGTDEYFEKQIDAIDKLTKKEEDQMTSDVNKIFAKQNKELIKEIGKESDLKKIEKKVKNYFDSTISKYQVFYSAALSKGLKDVYKEGANQSYKEFDDLGVKSFNKISDEGVTKSIKNKTDNLTKTTSSTSSKLIIDEINKEKNIGLSIAALSKIISSKFDDFSKNRSNTIVRTEIIDSGNKAKLDVYNENNDIVEAKQWYTALDERVCENCGPMHGKIVGLSDDFLKKGSNAPGGLKLDYKAIDAPTLHPNCRCVLIPVLVD